MSIITIGPDGIPETYRKNWPHLTDEQRRTVLSTVYAINSAGSTPVGGNLAVKEAPLIVQAPQTQVAGPNSITGVQGMGGASGPAPAVYQYGTINDLSQIPGFMENVQSQVNNTMQPSGGGTVPGAGGTTAPGGYIPTVGTMISPQGVSDPMKWLYPVPGAPRSPQGFGFNPYSSPYLEGLWKETVYTPWGMSGGQQQQGALSTAPQGIGAPVDVNSQAINPVRMASGGMARRRGGLSALMEYLSRR